MIWWLLEPRQRPPGAERQRHGHERALVREEDAQRALVQPHHGFRRAEPVQQRRDREHQADLRERQRERRVVRRVEVRDRLTGNAHRRHRIAADRRQQRVPEHARDQQRRPGNPPARHRVPELPGRPPHRVRHDQHQHDRDQHTPRVLVQPAHQRFHRQQHHVDAEEPQRCRDQETDVPGGALVHAAQHESEEDGRPAAEHQQRGRGELLQPQEERRLRVSRRVPADEEEQPEGLQHPRDRGERGQVLERAVDVHAGRGVDQGRDEPMAEDDGDHGESAHGVDERVPGHRRVPGDVHPGARHDWSPSAMRASAASVAVPGS